MLEQIFFIFDIFEESIWSYLGFPTLMLLGVYLTIQSRFMQIRQFPSVVKTFFSFFKSKDTNSHAVHPLKAFFACVGGAVGVGNIVSICTAVQIGGPGALLWIWLTAIVGAQ